MEGFSIPQSSKRIASLPSPCPTGLQSCCSAPPGSLPLLLCQAPAPCQIHAALGSLTSGHAMAQLCDRSMLCQDPHPSGRTDPCPTTDQHTTKIPAPQAMPWPSSVLDPCPARIPGSQAPCLSGHSGPQVYMEQLESGPTGILTSWEEPGPSSTGLPTTPPGFHSGHQ
jgi:hypothetical protein